EDPHDPGRGNRRADLDRQRLAVPLVEDVERAEAPPAVERILHEVERPDPVAVSWQATRRSPWPTSSREWRLVSSRADAAFGTFQAAPWSRLRPAEASWEAPRTNERRQPAARLRRPRS